MNIIQFATIMAFVPKFTPDPRQYERVALEWFALNYVIKSGGNPDLMGEYLSGPCNMMHDLMEAAEQIENSYRELVKNDRAIRILADRAYAKGMHPTILLRICDRYMPRQLIDIGASVGLAQLFL